MFGCKWFGSGIMPSFLTGSLFSVDFITGKLILSILRSNNLSKEQVYTSSSFQTLFDFAFNAVVEQWLNSFTYMTDIFFVERSLEVVECDETIAQSFCFS